MRLLRRVVPVVGAAVISLGATGIGAALSQTPVFAAAMSCSSWNSCHWSQMNNGNWQPNSNMNPDCGTSCIQWWQDCSYTLHYWNGWRGTGGFIEKDINWAEQTWNAVRECTPNFAEATSGPFDVQFVSAHLGPGPCAVTSPSIFADGNYNYISSMLVQVNLDVNQFPGPVPNGQSGCNFPWAMLHETGHTYGEGHSSFGTDDMYVVTAGQTPGGIDADAHQELAQVYGYNGPSACSGCQLDFGLVLPRIVLQGPTYFVQATVNKADAAIAEADAEGQSAPSQATGDYQWARCAGYSKTGACVGPPQP